MIQMMSFGIVWMLRFDDRDTVIPFVKDTNQRLKTPKVTGLCSKGTNTSESL